jgi:hypothetical protein
MDDHTVKTQSEPAPMPHMVKYIAPILYIVFYAHHVTCSPFELGNGFLIGFTFVLALGVLVDYYSARLDTCLTYISELDERTAETYQLIRERLKRYKDGYDKAIKKRDAAIAKETAVMKDMLSLHDRIRTLQDELLASLDQRNTDYRLCRKDQNDSRIASYKVLQAHQSSMIDNLEKLIRKFKNVSVPKVKGVSPSKSNSNSLTAPMERLVSGVKNAQQVTNRQLAVARKIREILEMEGEDVGDLYGRVWDAEKVLESVKRTALGANGEREADMESWGEKLDAQCRRLDKYFQSIVPKDKEKESGYHVIEAADADMQVDKA